MTWQNTGNSDGAVVTDKFLADLGIDLIGYKTIAVVGWAGTWLLLGCYYEKIGDPVEFCSIGFS
jgi:hypothetical protein